jgi:hypothetical protein
LVLRDGARRGLFEVAGPAAVERVGWSALRLAVQVAFELGIGPAPGVSYARQRGLVSRLMVTADHLLYGVITGHLPSGSSRSR